MEATLTISTKRLSRIGDPPTSKLSFFISQRALSPFLSSTVIDRYWSDPENKDIVNAFMHNKLCIDAAQGKPEAIAAYKKYAVVSSIVQTADVTG